MTGTDDFDQNFRGSETTVVVRGVRFGYTGLTLPGPDFDSTGIF